MNFLLCFGLFVLFVVSKVFSKPSCSSEKNFSKNKEETSCTNLGLSVLPLSDIPKSTAILLLSYNNFKSLSTSMFKGFKDLTELEVTDNEMSNFDIDIPLKIEELNLANNSLRKLPRVSQLSALTTLHLSNNHISSIPDNAFIGLKRLTMLKLQHNQIDSLPEEVFMALPALTHLDLSYNQLWHLPDRLLSGSESLTILYLSGNRLTEIPDNFFEDVDLGYVYLEKNPWNCNCALLYFKNWLEEDEDRVYESSKEGPTKNQRSVLCSDGTPLIDYNMDHCLIRTKGDTNAPTFTEKNSVPKKVVETKPMAMTLRTTTPLVTAKKEITTPTPQRTTMLPTTTPTTQETTTLPTMRPTTHRPTTLPTTTTTLKTTTLPTMRPTTHRPTTLPTTTTTLKTTTLPTMRPTTHRTTTLPTTMTTLKTTTLPTTTPTTHRTTTLPTTTPTTQKTTMFPTTMPTTEATILESTRVTTWLTSLKTTERLTTTPYPTTLMMTTTTVGMTTSDVIEKASTMNSTIEPMLPPQISRVAAFGMDWLANVILEHCCLLHVIIYGLCILLLLAEMIVTMMCLLWIYCRNQDLLQWLPGIRLIRYSMRVPTSDEDILLVNNGAIESHFRDQSLAGVTKMLVLESNTRQQGIRYTSAIL